MFEDIEDEFELDMIHQKDSDDEEEKKSKTRRRLSKKMNFTQVKLKKLMIRFSDYSMNIISIWQK